MPDTPDVDALISSAALAASQQDSAAAAALLREALDRQVTLLGPDHRDLAPTLNNLALMLERQGDADEAERCYRRAWDIARRSAAPDDPLVQVSRANLADFLRASGRPEVVDADPGPETADPEPESSGELATPPARLELSPPATIPEAPSTTMPAAPFAMMPASPRESMPAVAPLPPPPRPAAPQVTKPAALRPAEKPAGGVPSTWLAAGVALAMVAVLWFVLVPAGQPPAAPGAAASEPPASTPSAGRPEVQPAAPAPAVTPETVRQEAPSPAAPAAGNATTSPRAGAASAVTADTSLCETLNRSGGSWRCVPLRPSSRPDAVYFYTRVKSPRDIVVQHRWSHDGTVVRTVSLRVGANMEAGFRTFSRQTLGPRGAGQWEVALLAPGGAVIEAQRFAVP